MRHFLQILREVWSRSTGVSMNLLGGAVAVQCAAIGLIN
jgi:hypothetical protein